MAYAERARELLKEILLRMGVEADVQVREEEDRVVLDIEGPEAGLIIGKKGQTLDSLQYLVNRMLQKESASNGEAPTDARPVTVDSEDYRARRVESLVEMAHRLSEKAIRSRRTVAVEQMSAHDRRVIHVTLDKVPGVTTRSEGEGLARRLLIIPSEK